MKMRNRKTIVVVFLVLACMLVGIGYAATTGGLDLTINASSAAQDFKVLFTKAQAKTINDSLPDGASLKVRCEGTYLTANYANEATISTTSAAMVVEGMALTTDSVTIDFTIENFNNYNVELTEVAPTTTNFNVEGGFVSTGDTLVDTITVDATSTVTYRVTVTLKANAGYESISEKIVITFNGKAVD